MATQTTLESTQEALERIQKFDANTLSREDDLGKQMSFSDAVLPSQALIGIYKRIPLSALEDFSDAQLNVIKAQAQADYNVFVQILDFVSTAPSASDIRTNLITNLKARRDQLFDLLWQYVAYGVARITDTTLLETNARATIQSIKDQANTLTKELEAAKKAADSVLAEIRTVAAEQGVSQKAVYFKQEADDQEILASTWLRYTYYFSIAVGVFAIFSLFLHKFEFIRPDGPSEMVQLISSKLLIFAVLGYLLLLAARNYATYKHNAVINRHRQNALLTYRALVEASGNSGTEDIVLSDAYVKPPYRRQGVLREMISQTVRDHNVKMLFIDIARFIKNHTYYSTLGFTDVQMVGDGTMAYVSINRSSSAQPASNDDHYKICA